MMPAVSRFLVLSLLALVGAGPALRAAEPAIIAKARAYLGGDAALNAITTLHYFGTLDMGAAKTDAAKAAVHVEILFQKPYLQRSIITSAQGTEVTVLNGYDGWQRTEPASDKTRWTLSLLKVDQIKSLRANFWENLAFFRGIEADGGRVEDLGPATADRIACRKLAFIHSPEVVFYRYFDEATGRLVLTETQRGEKIREQGVIEVAGVKFPKVLITDTPKGDGTVQTVTINFDLITVNEPVPAGSFEVPLLISQ